MHNSQLKFKIVILQYNLIFISNKIYIIWQNYIIYFKKMIIINIYFFIILFLFLLYIKIKSKFNYYICYSDWNLKRF